MGVTQLNPCIWFWNSFHKARVFPSLVSADIIINTWMTFGDHIGYITSQNELETNWHVLASGEVLAFLGFCCFLSFVIKLFALKVDWDWQRVHFLYTECNFSFTLWVRHEKCTTDTKMKKPTCLMVVSPYLLRSTELQSAPLCLTLKPEFQGKLDFQRRP